MAAPRKWRQLLELLSGLKIPANAGVGKVLASDAEGNATWQLPGEASVAVASRTTALKAKTGYKQVPLNNTIKDPGGNFKEEAYVAPSDGYYQVSGQVELTNTAAESWAAFCGVSLEGVETARGGRTVGNATKTIAAITVSAVVFAKKGEKIGLFFSNQTAGEIELSTAGSELSCYLTVSRVGEGPVGPENKSVEESIASAYRSTAQKIPSGAFTAIKLNKAIKDPHGLFNLTTGAYVVPSEGFYQVNGVSLIQVAAAGEYNTVLKIYVNGAPKAAGLFLEKVGKEFIGGSVSGAVFCKAGDEITLQVYQNSGAEKETFASEEYNQMSVYKIGSGQTGPEGKAGAWKAMVKGAKTVVATEALYNPAEARTELGGASVRLKGALAVKELEEIKVGELIATLPEGCRPPHEISQPVPVITGTASAAMTAVKIKTNGEITAQVALSAATRIVFEGISLPLT